MGAPRITHQPALDGIRGVAVAGIVLFHSDFSWARGGFLGVSTFFTLSGFLITTLLLVEREESGRIRLARFWARRMRRLMPAALLGLALALAYGAGVADADQLDRLRGDVLWALAYAANWRFVLTQYSYTALFVTPSPVLHYWSLGIEEQFYFVYPVLVLALLRMAKGSRLALGGALAALAAVSLALCDSLYAAGNWVDRIYFGTDTRAAEFLTGGLLAVLLRGTGPLGPRARRGVDATGAAALALALGLAFRASLDSPWTYRGGLGLYALVSAGFIVAAVQPRGLVRTLLSWPPLRWLGRISYGVYVYHWPIFLWLDSGRTGLDGAPLLLVRAVFVLALADASYRFVEEPIRRGRTLTGWRPWVAGPAVAAGIGAAVVALTWNDRTPFGLSADPIPSRAAPARTAGRGGEPDVPRVAVFGDSLALALEPGLFRWLEETGLGRPTAGFQQAGCGVANDGGLRNRPEMIEPLCERLVEKEWAAAIQHGAPDLAVVYVGVWDLLDRRLPGEDRFRAPGDPVLDDYLRSQLESAVDVLSADGAGVVWLTIPPLHKRGRPTGLPASARSPSRISYFNGLLREVAAARPGRMRVVDLAGYEKSLARAGAPLPERSDALHFSRNGGHRLVSDWLGSEILGTTGGGAGAAELRREPQDLLPRVENPDALAESAHVIDSASEESGPR